MYLKLRRQRDKVDRDPVITSSDKNDPINYQLFYTRVFNLLSYFTSLARFQQSTKVTGKLRHPHDIYSSFENNYIDQQTIVV